MAVRSLPVAAALALTLAAVASGAGKPTVVHHYAPFSKGKLAPGLAVGKSAPGVCRGSSLVVGRRYAWRCFQGNAVRDPCFSQGNGGKLVVCPAAPWDNRVVELRLAKALGRWVGYKGRAALLSFPWAIETTTGKRCLSYAGRGAVPLVLGRPVLYGCEGGGNLAGPPRRHEAAWTIYFLQSTHSTELTSVGISNVWA